MMDKVGLIKVKRPYSGFYHNEIWYRNYFVYEREGFKRLIQFIELEINKFIRFKKIISWEIMEEGLSIQ